MRNRPLPAFVTLLSLVAGQAFATPFVPVDKADKQGAGVADEKGLLDCGGAVPVALGNDYAGDNTGAPNNVTTYGCSTWNESGGEVVFLLSLPAPVNFRASILDVACDLDLAALDACDEGPAHCLIVADDGIVTAEPVSGDFYLVVDGYRGAACAFTLRLEEIPPATFCGSGLPLECADLPLAGDTCDGTNNVVSAGCLAYAENGWEDYYAITLLPGGNFVATVTYASRDAALWVLDACAEPWTCLAGADATLAGGAETVEYENATGRTQSVYLVVDSWGSSCGSYTGAFSCTRGMIPTGGTSWGATKARYR